jgi:DNA-binding XRE family transcriptional regulator
MCSSGHTIVFKGEDRMTPFDPKSINNFRSKLEISQRAFGDALGVPQFTVHRWESGQAAPNAENLGKMHDLGKERGVKPNFFESENLGDALGNK